MTRRLGLLLAATWPLILAWVLTWGHAILHALGIGHGF